MENGRGSSVDLEDSIMESHIQNPFLIDVVIDNIFQTLPLEDLIRCREVCKKWRDNPKLQSIFRTKSAVSLRSIYLHTSATKDTIRDYFQSGGTIYTRFYFEHMSYQNALVKAVFQSLGPSMEILKLHLDLSQLNVDQFREMLYERATNLKELNIFSLSHEKVFLKSLFRNVDEDSRPTLSNLRRLELQEIRYPAIKFFTDFLRTLPNLREIVLKVDVCSDWCDQSDMWRTNSAIATSVIKGLQNSGAFRTLKEFRCGKLLVSHVDRLLAMGRNGLQLEILELHCPPKETEDTFTTFLETQSNSLRKLILFEQASLQYKRISGCIPRENQVFLLKLPERMPRLELLQLSKTNKTIIVPLDVTDYSKQCENLRSLILMGHDSNESLPNILHVPTTTSIAEVILNDRICNHEYASAIGNAFANLTKLTVYYPSQQFVSNLWTSCVKLKYLSVTFEECVSMDESITGASQRAIDRWLHMPKSHQQHVREAPRQLRDNASGITNLKDLQALKFIVDHDDKSERQAVSDVTAHFALLRMVQLRQLELLSSHWRIGLTSCSFFSDECQKLLVRGLCDAVIRFCPDAGENLEYSSMP